MPDQECCVEIIATPCDSVTGIITGPQMPVGVFIDVYNKADILVATYPKGNVVTALSGFYNPQGLATYPYVND